MAGPKQLICVVGPTAIGKTAMAVSLANMFDSEVISADSRQFYREMSIGTAVPRQEELKDVPHHFIQHISIHEDYSVGQFETEALQKLDKLFQKHDVIFMAGGSGLYVDAVVSGLDKFPEIPEQIRNSLRETLKENGLAELQEELKEVDPESYRQLDRNNPQRVLRALEVYRSSKKPISYFKGRKKPARPFSTTYIGLKADRETVYKRIDQRVDRMMADGLEEEARALYPYRQLNALQTVGYKELFASFEGRISLEDAVSEIKKNSRRFAKRQGTWFRKNEQIVWFDYLTPASEIATYIKKGPLQGPVNT